MPHINDTPTVSQCLMLILAVYVFQGHGAGQDPHRAAEHDQVETPPGRHAPHPPPRAEDSG